MFARLKMASAVYLKHRLRKVSRKVFYQRRPRAAVRNSSRIGVQSSSFGLPGG